MTYGTPQCSADVTILTVGVSQSGSNVAAGWLESDGGDPQGSCSRCFSPQFPGILLIASNPVDVMTYGAWRWSGLPASQIIGSGTSLDTASFRRRLAERYGVASDNVHAHIIGEHGVSQFPVLSSARIAGTPIEGFCQQTVPVVATSDENETERSGQNQRSGSIKLPKHLASAIPTFS